MTIICLEGPDLAGKTTLAQWLQADIAHRGLTSTYIKRGPIREDPMTEYLRPLDVLIEDSARTPSILVLDRWHVGELIYGPLLRGRSELTQAQANYIEMVMQTLGCAFIHVTAPRVTLEDRWDVRGDSLIKREWIGQISDAYWDYTSQRLWWETVYADIAYLTPHTFVPTSPIAERTEWHGRYIGPRDPGVLLLGDERASDEFTWPFVPRRATSGHWLMGALIAGDVSHMRVGVVNACELSSESLYRLWNFLGRPPVVTLGRNAERAWRMANPGIHVDQTYLRHPQYQRRFHYQSFVEYGEQIKKAMR